MHRMRIFIFLSVVNITLPATVTWLPNTSFNLPINFKGGKLPCSKQTVVFPKTLSGPVVIETGISVSEIILPIDGEIILNEATIELGPTEDANCTTGNVYFIERSVASWAQPDVWSSPKFNKATPDAERLPCFDDVVVFPQNNVFTVVLPDVTQSVQGLEVGGDSYTSDFKDYIIRHSDQAQQFILNQNMDVGVTVNDDYCKSRSGCPCQQNVLKIDCTVKFCEKPVCINPIQPIGHCCKICGGAIVFEIDQSFDVMQFQELVDRIVDSYDKNDLEYHIGRIPDNKLQLIVVDKNGYEQTSVLVVNAISYNMEKDLGPVMQLSGAPLYKKDQSANIVISSFFTVVFVMGSIYVYYYIVPQINYSVITGGRAGMFSRFNRRTESVVSLTRRDSAAPIGVSTGTAFRNPMYDSKRGRVLLEESALEEEQ